MKARHFIAFLAAVLISPCALSAETTGSDVKAEIIALDNAWIEAEVGQDQAALETILDERFLATFASGRTIDRATFISIVMQSDIEPFEVVHEEIRIHGNTAVVVDTSTDGKTKYTWVAVKKGKSWKVISEVFSKIAEAN